VPNSTTAPPASVCSETPSPRYHAAEIIATTGLRNVTDIARTAPMRRNSRKYSKKPMPELATPRNATSAQARGLGSWTGQLAQAKGAVARLAASRLPTVMTIASTPAR